MYKKINEWSSGSEPIIDCIIVIIIVIVYHKRLLEPRHDKTNKVTVRPAKTQISLGIRPV